MVVVFMLFLLLYFFNRCHLMCLECLTDLWTLSKLCFEISASFYSSCHYPIIWSVSLGTNRITSVSCIEIPAVSLYEQDSLIGSNIHIDSCFSFLLLINDALNSSGMCSVWIILCIILHFMHNLFCCKTMHQFIFFLSVPWKESHLKWLAISQVFAY